MKILKLLAMLCMVAAMSAVATSCKDDDDDDDNNVTLLGTWRDSYDGDWDEITFSKDGSYKWTFYEEGIGQETTTGTYTYNHPTLTLKYDGDTEVYTVMSVSATELVLNDEVEGEVYTYTKK